MFSKEKVYLYIISLLIVIGNISILLKFGLFFYVMKATILSALILLAYIKLKEIKHPNIPLLIIAFFFAFLGGLMIHITLEEQLFLIMALCSYAMSNLVYLILFYYSYKDSSPIKPLPHPLKGRWVEIILSVIFWAVIYVIYPFLQPVLIPALIFAFIGYLSGLAALNRRFYVESKSFSYVAIGLFCLFIGDVISTTDFTFTDPIKHVFVFTFNTFSHLLIYMGMIKQFELESLKYEKLK
jgi:hypothetical protein